MKYYIIMKMPFIIALYYTSTLICILDTVYLIDIPMWPLYILHKVKWYIN